MIETFDSTLMKIALGGLALSGLLFAAAFAAPYVKAAWDRASKFARAVFCGAVVCACLFGGAKHRTGGISYPKTDNEIAYLTDAGSYVTNDAVHVAFTRLPMVPSSATFYLDYCALDGTNAQGVATNWVNAKTATFGELSVPFDFAFANATNYNWLAYTDWTPGPAVQTNGVWHTYWGLDRKQGRYFIPVRTCVRDGGEVIATPKSKWDYEESEEFMYAKYAPDAAWRVSVTNNATYSFNISSWGKTPSEDRWVDWGDGTKQIVGTGVIPHSYTSGGVYVVRVANGVTALMVRKERSSVSDFTVVRILRWADTQTLFHAVARTCRNLTGPIPRWPQGATGVDEAYEGCHNLTGKIPAWTDKITSCRYTYSLYKPVSSLTGPIPKWGKSMRSVASCYSGRSDLTSAWTDDPAELMPTNITSHGNCVIDTSDALRALFYSDWGGTRTKTE